tara:strand:- start:243 stop:497 length:255 start_codon:yes stop_codon:yes gene_type:complete
MTEVGMDSLDPFVDAPYLPGSHGYNQEVSIGQPTETGWLLATNLDHCLTRPVGSYCVDAVLVEIAVPQATIVPPWPFTEVKAVR